MYTKKIQRELRTKLPTPSTTSLKDYEKVLAILLTKLPIHSILRATWALDDDNDQKHATTARCHFFSSNFFLA